MASAVRSPLTLPDMTASEPRASGVDAGADVNRVGEPRTLALGRWLADWRYWRGTPAASAGLDRWRRRHPCLAGFASLEELLDGCGWDPGVPQHVADARLAALVGEASAGDSAAVRVVLERVLPGLVHRAARRARRDGRPFGELLGELVAVAWLVIAEYPLARRPVKIAANIIRDTEYRLFGYVPATVRSSRPAAPDTLPLSAAGPDGRPVDGPTPAAVEVLELLADAVRAGFPHADAVLLAELCVAGVSPSVLATRDGVTARAVRIRRRVALTRLCAHVARPMPGSGPEATA